jgi:hypothetical protein
MKRFASYVLAVAVAAAPAVAGGQVFGTANGIQMSGSRSIAAGDLVGGVPGYTSLNVAWSIMQEGNFLRYTYTFSNLQPGNQISHAIISLTPGCTVNSGCVFSLTGGQAEFGTFTTSPSNPGFPEGYSISGVKFNTTGDPETLVFSFLSERQPMWGDLYVKGASNLYAYNVGLTNHASTDIGDFIAVPDTQPVSTVPEPATVALMGTGLLGVAAAARRKRSA